MGNGGAAAADCVYLPARELVLAQAHLQTVAARRCRRAALDEAGQLVALHAIDAPGARARPHAQAGLLRVDGEHGKLGLGEGAWRVVFGRTQQKNKYGGENTRIGITWRCAPRISCTHFHNDKVVRHICVRCRENDSLGRTRARAFCTQTRAPYIWFCCVRVRVSVRACVCERASARAGSGGPIQNK